MRLSNGREWNQTRIMGQTCHMGRNRKRVTLAASHISVHDQSRCPHCGEKGEVHKIKQHVKFCGPSGRKTISAQETSRAKEVNQMGWNDERKTKGGGKPLLKGSDVPKNVQTVSFTVSDCRKAPENFGAFFILDFAKPLYETEGWAVNKTNGDALAEKFGDNWSEEIIGKKVTLSVGMANNPQTKKAVRSLFVA